MSLLKSAEREEIVQDICSKFHKDGFAHLKVVGNFSKYTSLYHFTIKEIPYAIRSVPLCHMTIREPYLDAPFIFITELFGNEEYEKRASKFLIKKGIRAQYHGNFDGLYKIILQGITANMITSDKYGGGRSLSAPYCEIARKHDLSMNDKLAFDNALIYIRDSLHYIKTDTIDCDPTLPTFWNTYDKP